MRNILLLVLLIAFSGTMFSQNKNQFTEVHAPYMTISPTISRLQNMDPDNISYELDVFWSKLDKEGCPLIEKDSLYDDYLYLTLVYQDSSENKDISFEVFGIYDDYRFGDMKMHRLGNTDLYYRCYMIPDDICFSYRFVVKDTLSGNTFYDTDKYNENRNPTGVKKSYSYSVLDLRQDEPDWNRKRYENTRSRVDTFVFDSKIINNSRNIYIYLPPDYDHRRGLKYPVIYLFDSFIYLNRVEVPNVLDNLIEGGKIEPMIAVMIDNPTNTSRKTELPLNFKFKDFITTELVPHIRKEYNIASAPDKNIIGGISYGGLAAAFIAFYHPDIFGKVLSQSGGFWRDLELTDNYGNEIRQDWLINKILVEEKKDMKIFLDWGLQENWCMQSGRRMVKALDKKGYEYRFIEFNGWHDWSNSRKTFPTGLMYLLSTQ